jgi:exonuclease SbcC
VKILTISIQNLASLATDGGKPHVIDFTAAPLSNVGVFGITGKTGAGKSTILDALSLALYGETPRSSDSGTTQIPVESAGETWTAKNPRHIVRRGATDAHAIVTFEEGGRTFTASWTCSSKVSKGTRTLGDPERALAENGVVIAIGNKASAKVAEVTGLDFDRFCRSVLLPQGRFEAFLAAKANERAKLLEALTDPTGLYREVSKRAHKRGSEANATIAKMEAAVNAVEVLSEADRDAIVGEIGDHRRVIADTDAKLREIDDENQAWTSIEAARDAERARRHNAETASVAHASAEEERKFVAAVERARPLRVPRQRLEDASAQVEVVSAEVEAARKRRAAAIEAEKGAAATHEAAEEALRVHADTTAVAQPDLRHAARLDDDIERWRVEAAAAARELGALVPEQKRLSDLRAAAAKRLATLRDARTEIHRWFDENPEAPPLAERHEVWALALADWIGLDKALQGANERVAAATRDHERAVKTLEAKRMALTEAARKAASLKTRADDERTSARDLRAEAVRVPVASVVERIHRLERVQAAAEGIVKARAAIAEAEGDIGRDRETVATETRAITELATTIEGLDRDYAAADDARRFAERVAAVEEHRHRLEPGAPCVVCGSLEHPWADAGDRAPAASEATARIERLARERDAAIRERQSASSRRDQATGRIGPRERTLADAHHALSELVARWPALTTDAGLALPADFTAAPSAVATAIAGAHAELGVRKRAESDASAAEARAEATRAEAEKASAEHDAAVHAEKDAEHQVDIATRAAGERHDDVADLDRRRDAALIRAEGALDGVQNARARILAAPARVRDTWTALVARFGDEKQKLIDVENEARAVEDEDRTATIQLASLDEQRKPIALRATKAAEAGQQASQDRAALFEGRAIAEVEHELEAKRRQLATAADAARTGWGDARADLATREGAVVALESRLERETHDAAEAKRRYLDALGDAEIDIAEAERRLSVTDADLAERQRLLHVLDQNLEITARAHAEAVTHLGVVEAHTPPRDRSTLDDDKQRLNTDRDGRIGAVGRSEARLDHDVRQHLKRAQCQAELDAVRDDRGVWTQLDDLIGNANGDTFAVFAQTLAFDVLLGAANTELNRLNARYSLRRLDDPADPSAPATPKEAPLEVAIVDADLGDAVRPTNTLSGGEKFLVSLALALGLSALAARSRPIGSMFIDEGFGTLDPEALSAVLSVLETLHDRGTKVGVISHVAEIHERLPARIVVDKRAQAPSHLRIEPLPK